MSIKSWKKGFMKKHCPFATEAIFDFPRFAAAHCKGCVVSTQVIPKVELYALIRTLAC